MSKLLLLFTATFLTVSSPQIDKCRSMFFAIESEAQVDELYELSSKMSASDPVALAYKGCSRSMQAEYSFNPYSKWTSFSEGRDMIEQAVKRAPNEPEIRFIRLSIQLFAPQFLGYHENVNEDTRLVCRALAADWLLDTPDFRKEVTGFLLTYAPLTEAEKKTLAQ